MKKMCKRRSSLKQRQAAVDFRQSLMLWVSAVLAAVPKSNLIPSKTV